MEKLRRGLSAAAVRLGMALIRLFFRLEVTYASPAAREAVERGGVLYLPAAWFFRMILNRHVTECRGVLYACEGYAELSAHMARLLRELLQKEG